MTLPLGSLAEAQTFFGDLGGGITVGVERGSTTLLPEVTVPTRFLTFDTYGSDDVGRDIASLSLAYPGALAAGDQFDAVFLFGGIGGAAAPEVLAGGLGYQVPLGPPGLAWVLLGDHAELVVGGAEALALDLRIASTNLSTGLRQRWTPDAQTKIDATLEFKARRTSGTLLGAPVLDEDLRVLQASLRRESGVPFGFRTRSGVAIAKGFDAFGASQAANPLASRAGASSSFLRISAGAEMSLPISARLVVNAGVAVQWADVPLPLSERCAYGTNAYSRGFDMSEVNGDRCIASRVELARYLALPAPGDARGLLAQGFSGIDFGIMDSLATATRPETRDGWSSLTLGARIMRGDAVGEVAVSTVLDDFAGSGTEPRLWVRLALRM